MRVHTIATVCGFAIVLTLLMLSPIAVAQGTYASVDVPGATSTDTTGINSIGEIVGSYTDSSGTHGFLLSAGVYTTIDYPGALITGANGINDKGKIVGGVAIPPNSSGFIYDRSTQEFTLVTYPGAPDVVVLAINNGGTVVGQATPIGRSFEQNPAGKQMDVTGPLGVNVAAWGISDSAVVFAYYEDQAYHFRDIKFRAGNSSEFRIPGARGAEIFGTNPAGDAIVGEVPNGPSFVYRNGALQILSYPGATFTSAEGVNAAGQVVGRYYKGADGPHGYVWTPPQ